MGGGQSLMYLMKFRPHVLLSNGGFVSVPVAVAAWLLRIPVVTYEPDQSPGLANRIIMKFARKILYTFPETVKHLPKNKAIYAGTPIRRELFGGSKSRAFQLCGFDAEEKIPQILVMGGSLGALKINQTLLQCLPSLVQNYRVIHITGKGKGISFAHKNYKSFSYLKDELKDIFAISDYIISRAGANAIFEFLALKKPMLLIPLELGSRGDQVLNANSFLQQGWARVLKETDLSAKKLLESLHSLVEDGEQIKKCQSKGPMQDSDQVIFKIMQQYSEARSITEP